MQNDGHSYAALCHIGQRSLTPLVHHPHPCSPHSAAHSQFCTYHRVTLIRQMAAGFSLLVLPTVATTHVVEILDSVLTIAVPMNSRPRVCDGETGSRCASPEGESIEAEEEVRGGLDFGIFHTSFPDCAISEEVGHRLLHKWELKGEHM